MLGSLFNIRLSDFFRLFKFKRHVIGYHYVIVVELYSNLLTSKMMHILASYLGIIIFHFFPVNDAKLKYYN